MYDESSSLAYRDTFKGVPGYKYKVNYLKIKAVVLGSRIRMMTAAKRLGLYSAFRAWSAIFFKSNLQPRDTVETIFCKAGTIPGSKDCGGCIDMGVAGDGGAGLAENEMVKC